MTEARKEVNQMDNPNRMESLNKNLKQRAMAASKILPNT